MAWLIAAVLFASCWILAMALLLAFPLPTNWMRSRRTTAKQGVPLSLPLPPKGGGDNAQWYEARNPPGGAKAAILIVHGRSRSRGFMEPLALALSGEFNVLTFDLRHHGDRGYGPVSYGLLESEDVHAALDHIKGRGISRIGIVGISMGAASASKALSEKSYPEVLALALIGPVSSAREIVRQYAPKLGLPAFLQPLLMALGSLLAGVDLRKADTARWLAAVPQPKALLTGDHDEVLGMGHSRILESRIKFDLVKSYVGGHDEPGNPELQDILRGWLREKLS